MVTKLIELQKVEALLKGKFNFPTKEDRELTFKKDWEEVLSKYTDEGLNLELRRCWVFNCSVFSKGREYCINRIVEYKFKNNIKPIK